MILLSMGIRRHATAVLCVASVVAGSLSVALAQDARMDGALQEGRSLANQRSAEALQGIKSPAPGQGPAAVVPHYNDSTDGRYQGGKGNPAPAGTQKIIDCAAATPEQLAGFAGTQCAATNFLTKNATTRPAVSISKSDPLISGAQGKVELGKQMGLPSSMSKTTSEAPQCETVIKPGGDKVETVVCHEEGQAREEKCQVGRVIEVDGEFRYECETQVKRIKQVQCDITYGEECTTAPSTKVCPNGAKPANGICTSYAEEERPADVSGYSCADGYTLSGTSCVRVETQAAAVSGYSCPSGYVVSGSQCVKTTTETINATPALSCPSDSVLSGTQCLSTQTISATISGYSCPSGYVNSGSSCVLTETVPPTVNNTCPSGYNFSGSTCVKTTTVAGQAQFTCSAGYTQSGNQCTRQVSTAATVSSYSCPSGYTVSGSSCTRTITDTIAGTAQYSCSTGFVLSGTSCTRTIVSPATKTYSCPAGAGYVLSGNVCTKTSQTTAGYGCPAGARIFTFRNTGAAIYPQDIALSGWMGWVPANWCAVPITIPAVGSGPSNQNAYPTWVLNECLKAFPESRYVSWNGGASGRFCHGPQGNYICPAGTTRSGSMCVTTTSQAASMSYSCPGGGTVSGSSCLVTESIARTLSGYSCPSGYVVSGSQCVKTTTETISGTPVLSCPSGGVLSGDQCLSTQTINATISGYTCPSGYANSGSSCVLTETVPPTVNNTCPSGYNLSGGTCVKTTTVAGQAQFSCALGYTLSGNQCTRQVSTAAIVSSYSCPSGYTVSGSSCTRTITDTIAGTAQYSCSTGFVLSGNTCSKTTTTAATPVYSCQPGGTLSGDRCTYIVTTTSDAVEQFSCDDPSARLTAGALQGGRQTYVCCKETVNNQCGGLEALLK
jgi:conjugal transfer mating pair stabilization protein TraN